MFGVSHCWLYLNGAVNVPAATHKERQMYTFLDAAVDEVSNPYLWYIQDSRRSLAAASIRYDAAYSSLARLNETHDPCDRSFKKNIEMQVRAEFAKAKRELKREIQLFVQCLHDGADQLFETFDDVIYAPLPSAG